MIDYDPALADGSSDLLSRSREPALWICKRCGHAQKYRVADPGNPPQMALVISSPSDYTLCGYTLPLPAIQEMIRSGYADVGVVFEMTGGLRFQVVQDGKRQRLKEVQWTRKA